jgi:drug/metabolite transporter (DMT)-like permease
MRMDRRADARPATGIMLAFICLFLLGLMPIISNSRPAGSDALAFALWLSVWQLVFSLPLLDREWRSGERGILTQRLPQREKARVLAMTLLTGALFGLSTWLYVLAFEKAGAVSAAIALQAYPLFAASLEALFLGRRKSPRELGFTLMIVAALYYLATQGTWRPQGLSAWFLVALAVPALWSIAHVTLRQALVTTPITPNQVTTSRLLVSTAVLLPLALSLEGPVAIVTCASSLGFQAFAAMMGLAYYLELIVWFNAVRHIDVSLASSITVPAPAVTTVLAAIFLGESIEGVQLVALGIVITGLFGLLHASAPQPSGAPQAF